MTITEKNNAKLTPLVAKTTYYMDNYGLYASKVLLSEFCRVSILCWASME